MTLWSDLFLHRHLLSRVFYGTPGVQTITAPANATFVRVSMVGAGGWDSNTGTGPGGVNGAGAAFARVKTTCTAGESFSIQIGDIAHSKNAGDALGDSKFTRVTGSVLLCSAARGTSTAPGNASTCTGDTKRTGGAAAGTLCGPSAGDDVDTFPLGFGGRGAKSTDRASDLAAAPGGGGSSRNQVYQSADLTYSVYLTYPPGNGRICVEFFDQDPTIQWPGYTG